MCNYCSITLYPEDVKWVALEPEVEGALPASCRASAANAHVPGIEGYTARSSRVKNGQQQYDFCSSHSARFNSPPPQLPALIDQGAIASIYSAAGAVSTIRLYFYNYSRPDDINVTAWASSLNGQFELLLPPGEGWSEGDVITPRKGNRNKKRGAK